MSAILAVALYLQIPCHQVFEDSISIYLDDITLPKNYNHDNEKYLLKEFAEYACKMDNPDYTWFIAYNESRFRFEVINLNGSPKAYYGDKAIKYLRNLAKKKNTNVDIGVMQINWRWHNQEFENSPFKMLRPRTQIEYIKNKFKPELVKVCGEKWVGCYHSKSRSHKQRYIKNIYKSAKVMRKYLKKVVDLRKSNQRNAHVGRQSDWLSQWEKDRDARGYFGNINFWEVVPAVRGLK